MKLKKIQIRHCLIIKNMGQVGPNPSSNKKPTKSIKLDW